MADNITGTDYSGSSITLATNDRGGVHEPKTIIIDPATGQAQDIAGLLQEVCLRLADIADSVGNLTPDNLGRIRINAEVVASHAVTLASLATVTTLTTLTNQAQMGGLALNAYVQHMTLLSEGDLRRNVVIS